MLFIALGGAIGTICRYFLSGLDYKFSGGVFPFSTFLVNLLGSLAIGFLWGFFERSVISPQMRMFIFIGILGGFTTFSTLSLETFNLIRDGEIQIAFANIVLTNIIGVTLVFAGYAFSRYITGIFR